MAGFSNNISLIILLGFLSLLLGFSYLLGKILLKFATNLGVRNHSEGVIRWTSTTKPSLGGILFFVAFLLSIVFYLIILSENVQFNNWQFLGMVISCVLGFVMGLADDAYNTKPILKLLIQALCGLVVIICGAHIQIFAQEWLNYMFTIFWFIGLMNSLNMLDNMDGITSSVSTIASISMLVFSYITSTLFEYDSILIVGVLASLLGFLFFNWHPAKMYMGDSGSQFLGAFMAAASIKVLWNVHPNPSGFVQTWFFILLPVSFFIVTISDTATVSINRLMKKKSPFVGGKDHTTHHLVYGGFKQRLVAILYIIISVVSSVLGFTVYYCKLYSNTYVVVAFTLYLFLVFIALFSVTKKFKQPQDKN